MQDTDLARFLLPGGRRRERAETRRLFMEAERVWSRSPWAARTLNELAAELVEEALGDVGPVRPDAAGAVDWLARQLLALEGFGPLDPDWDAIGADIRAGVALRATLARRIDWARQPAIVRSILKDHLRVVFDLLFADLPAARGDGAGPVLTTPLADALTNLPEVAERLLVLAHESRAIAHGVFEALRATYAQNLLAASGLRPTEDIRERADRLVWPTRHKPVAARDLTQLYFGGTPLAALFDRSVRFEMPMEARFEHCHIVGGTGHGKTQLMQGMIHADLLAALQAPRSVAVIDSQGDLISKISRLALFDPATPGGLASRLIIVDPADVEHPASLNLFDAHLDRLAGYDAVDRERVLNGVVELYETFFGDLLGAELTQKQGVIFKYLARLMMAIPGATIHTLMRLMDDGTAFKDHMAALDGSARYFFETEFFHPSFAATKKQILKRLWGVLATPSFERMFAQARNRLDLFQALNDGKIILINTAKDLLKTEGSRLFGRFFIQLISQAALERSTLGAAGRTPTFVYVDEAQEYFDDTVETILNQARKYKVGLTLAHQSLDQLTPRLRAVLHANCSMKCAGGVSARDARALAEELHTTSEFIESMRRRADQTEFAVWVKQVTPHAVRLCAPLGLLERQPTLPGAAYQALIARNRELYCGTLADVDAGLANAQRQSSVRGAPDGDAAEPSRRRRAAPAPLEPEDDPSDAWPDLVAAIERNQAAAQARNPPPRPPFAPPPARRPGKGGPKHRYLQALIKGLAEQQGFRATLEAPIPGGEVDVMLVTADSARVAVQISVTTPIEHERQSLTKCLTAGCGAVAVVVVKNRRTQAHWRAELLRGLAPQDAVRVSVLAPEDIPDFVAALAPSAPEPDETVVKGYRVRVSQTVLSPAEADEKRVRLAQLLARSMKEDE